MTENKCKKIIISGGGTGGHVFPAIAIADALKKRDASIDIRFVGAKGKIEMEKVPQAGYPIYGLRISGFKRNQLFANFTLPFKLLFSLIKSIWIIGSFKPDIAVGVGGYASGPLLKIADMLGIPTVIQEQNSYPGMTNKILSAKAKKIFVSYPNLDRFFPKDRIRFLGNPIRSLIENSQATREEAIKYFQLDETKKTILVIGGSLGAKMINQSIYAGLPIFREHDIQIIWQTGRLYLTSEMLHLSSSPLVKMHTFIDRMDLAYRASDIIISRAGALSVSELCYVAKPTIFVPSPNVAEDHQTHNAMSLVNQQAAIHVSDKNARTELVDVSIKLLNDRSLCQNLSQRIRSFAKPYAADYIAEEINQIIEKKPVAY